MKMIVLAALMTVVAVPASAQDWKTGSWMQSAQRDGHCQLDMSGAAKRSEVRDVACVAKDGTVLREQDCDAQKRPAAQQQLSCQMKWTCAEWLDGVFVEGEKVDTLDWNRERGDKVGASVACTNAKEADPKGVHSCRALRSADKVEVLADAGTSSSNAGYASITCRKAAR